MCFTIIYPLVRYPLKALYSFLLMADFNLAVPSFQVGFQESEYYSLENMF